MKKQLATAITIVAITASLALPTATQAFNPGQFFANAKQRFVNTIQRVYLRVIPGKKPGELVMGQSFMAMKGVKSADMNGTIDVNMKHDDTSLGTAKFSLNGPIQGQEPYDPNMQQQLSINGEVHVEGVQVSGAADMIIDGQKDLYLKVTEIPLPMQQLRQLKNQWMKFDLQKNRASGDMPTLTPEIQARYEEALTKLYKDAQWSEARKDKWQDKPVFVVDAQFNNDAVLNYISTISQITADATHASRSAMTDEDKNKMSDILSAVGPFKGTFYVDQGTFYIRHSEVPITIDIQKLQEATRKPGMQAQPMMQNDQTPNKIEMNIQFTFDKFNEPVTITIPDDAKPAEELLGTGPTGMMAPPAPTQTVPEMKNLTPAQRKMLEQQMQQQQQPGY